MITDFLYLIIDKTFKYNEYQNNNRVKLQCIKKIFQLSSKKIILEPEFYKTNYDYFIIDCDTDNESIDYKSIYRLSIDTVSIPIDFSKLKHLYKIFIFDYTHFDLFKNKCHHFKNIRFIQTDNLEIPLIYEKNFYKSIKNAYRFATPAYYLNNNYLPMLTNIHNLNLSADNYTFSYLHHIRLLKNNYILSVNGRNITFENIFCFMVKYIYCEIDSVAFIVIKKSQYEFEVKKTLQLN